MTDTMLCAKCNLLPIKNKCKECGQHRCKSKKEWNWNQVQLHILAKLVAYQEEHGKGALPAALSVESASFQHIPRQFRESVFNIQIREQV